MTRSLTVVMPCLNEADNVSDAAGSVLEAFNRFGIEGELIIVDDGSRDRTRSIAEELARRDARARLLCHDRPMGLGASFWHGSREATKDFVVMIPGDNENDPGEVFRYLFLVEEVDIIVPFPHNVEIRSRARRFLSGLFRFIINISFGVSLNYTNGTVIYNRKVLWPIELFSRGFFYQAELLIRLIRSGYLYAEVPVYLKKRVGGRTKAISLRSFRAVTAGYLRLFWLVHALRRTGHIDFSVCPGSVTARRAHNAALGCSTELIDS